jgi:hypothetical protein
VFNELCFNLESFNPAFAACVLMVRAALGQSALAAAWRERPGTTWIRAALDKSRGAHDCARPPPPRNPRPQVQKTIGVSDYVRRDMALKNLIQPLAGE